MASSLPNLPEWDQNNHLSNFSKLNRRNDYHDIFDHYGDHKQTSSLRNDKENMKKHISYKMHGEKPMFEVSKKKWNVGIPWFLNYFNSSDSDEKNRKQNFSNRNIVSDSQPNHINDYHILQYQNINIDSQICSPSLPSFNSIPVASLNQVSPLNELKRVKIQNHNFKNSFFPSYKPSNMSESISDNFSGQLDNFKKSNSKNSSSLFQQNVKLNQDTIARYNIQHGEPGDLKPLNHSSHKHWPSFK